MLFTFAAKVGGLYHYMSSRRLLNRCRYRSRGHVWLIHYATGINACTRRS